MTNSGSQNRRNATVSDPLSVTSTLLAGHGESDSRDSLYSSGGTKRIRDTIDSIPTPGTEAPKPKPYQPILLSMFVEIGTPIVLMVLGIILEIATNISTRDSGFKVPTVNVFGTVSGQFLASIIPTLIIIPYAILYRETDWSVRCYQPYLVLQKGNAPAEESLLLDYIELGPVLGLFRAARYKHRIVFWSALSATITFGFQPLASSIFQIRQTEQTWSQEVNVTEIVSLNSDIFQLNGFLAAAGYTEAASLHKLGDPPFVFRNWATTQFDFPEPSGLNGSISVNTTAVRTNVNCANPSGPPQIDTSQAPIWSFTSQSVEGCRPNTATGPNVTFNSSLASQQYGVVEVICDNNVVDEVVFRPVMFWFYNRDTTTVESQIRTVFCAPTLEHFRVMATAYLMDGRLESCDLSSTVNDAGNTVTGPPLNGRALNGLIFNVTTEDPFVQARAISISSGISGTIMRQAIQEGLQQVFALPNGILDITQEIYTRHLSVSARSLYFSPAPPSNLNPGTMTAFIPRLWIDPLPAHVLAFFLVVIGVIGVIVHLLHRRQRKKLLLAAAPGTIASITALTSRSGFGELLLPYDNDETLEKKLEGIRFRLDSRTGAVVADEDSSEDIPGMGRDNAMLSLLGKQNERLIQHSTSSQTAYQSAVGYPPWVYKNPYEPLK